MYEDTRRSDFRDGTKTNTIVAISSEGVIACALHQTTIDGVLFRQFINEQLLPTIQAFPARRSVVIMDNAGFHLAAGEAITNLGALVVWLPTYSPQKNPIEILFGWAKGWLRANPEVMQRYPDMAMLLALQNAPNEFFRSWAEHCGYMFDDE